MVSVCMSRCVCVCMSFQLLSFKLSSGYLFSPHHVNQGVVQKPTPQVTLYESHAVEESLMRNDAAVAKVRKYRADYNMNPPNTVSFMSVITSTSGRLHSEFVRLLFLQVHRETDHFFSASGVQFA
jgi:hypothetical protein